MDQSDKVQYQLFEFIVIWSIRQYNTLDKLHVYGIKKYVLVHVFAGTLSGMEIHMLMVLTQLFSVVTGEWFC